MLSSVQQHDRCHLEVCPMYSVETPSTFISCGHGGSSRDQTDGSPRAGVALDGVEQHEDGNAVCIALGGLEISGDCNGNIHNEELPSAIINGRTSNGSSRIMDGSKIESPDDVTSSIISGNADAKHMEMQNGNDELHTGEDKMIDSCNGDTQQACSTEKPRKRAFCKRCEKALALCICSRFKGTVQNKVRITILQNPKEKQHAVGSVRIALLGLENIALVTVPEIHTNETFRIRPKVPGSKRNLAGRGGKKLLLNGGKVPVSPHDKVPSDVELLQVQNVLREVFEYRSSHHCDFRHSEWSSHSSIDGHGLLDGLIQSRSPVKERESTTVGDGRCCVASKSSGGGSLSMEDLESLIPPGVALLFPSEKALELSELLHGVQNQEMQAPSHLLVLDGTWSKARRIYFENPWLNKLPHVKLSPPSPSLYEGVRKQPKPGCLSTLESIIYALRILEPDNIEGIDGLLEVFDSMVDDQRRCKQMKCSAQDLGL